MRIALPKAHRRPGYTLLEILVATVIALLLMSGLYVAFDVTLGQTQSGSDLVREADLSRAVFNRMNMDLALPVGPLPPKSGGGIDDQAAATTPSTGTGTTSDSTTTGSTTTGSTTTDTAGTTTTPTDTTASADAQSTIAASIPLQAGVIGTSNQLTMFVSKVPPFLLDRSGMATADQQAAPDLRKITYYLGNNGGLYREEKPWVTADGVQNTTEPDRSNDAANIIAPEVSAVLFEYADGTGWVSTWDGSYPSTDGTSTQGPPRAIRVTLTLDLPDSSTGKLVKKQIQHVFAVRAAVGLAAPPEPPVPEPETATTGGTG
jgi:prepilin-type N-terminal cleavage/methylation domain-containing protein